ncbi:hypothetical protein CBM2634_P180001 [Cupriavidus taiwanensis]|uniref:Transposase InsH N-terminal domain-containing protein n=1 Tax=Cupriavidus taiwanensis TaxID=164546 RepID=A0A375JAT3_9BURK|nr:hypothetical protein CBM2634_P180001 [Cupriavidus taiwanensis]
MWLFRTVTRRQRFLTEMESVVPWARLIAAVEPYYPKGKRGRPPIGLERMLRIYFLQQWYGLSDEALEDALYDSMAMRAFAGIDLAVEAVPDATTLLKFRRLLVEHELTQPDERNLLDSRQGLFSRPWLVDLPQKINDQDDTLKLLLLEFGCCPQPLPHQLGMVPCKHYPNPSWRQRC